MCGAPAFLAEALRVYLPSDIYYGWYTIEDNFKVVRSRWRLPNTRFPCVLEVCGMMDVGGSHREEFPFAAQLSADDTKEHGKRASLLDEAPCLTMVLYYGIGTGPLQPHLFWYHEDVIRVLTRRKGITHTNAEAGR